MKKMLLLLAGMACLGMFVSCSDEPQEVDIVSTIGNVNLTGYADGTVISKSASTTTSYNYSVNKQKWATLSYSEVAKGSKSYTLKVPILYSYGVSSGSQSKDSVTISIVKIDGKYYDSVTEQNIEVKGSLEGGDFTVMAVSGGNDSYSFTNLSFKKGVAK